jgi:hypothetical protein
LSKDNQESVKTKGGDGHLEEKIGCFLTAS